MKLPQRRILATKFMTDTVVRRTCLDESRQSLRTLPHPMAAADLPPEEDEATE
jgi:hypothetical protein